MGNVWSNKMAREYRYKLASAPTPRNDGTKGVGHDIAAVYREEGAPDPNPWIVMPGHHIAGLSVPGEELITALSSGTAGQKGKKYKDLVKVAIDAGGFLEPFEKGWEEARLDEFMANNDIAIAAAEAADQFIIVTLSGEYPFYFELE